MRFVGGALLGFCLAMTLTMAVGLTVVPQARRWWFALFFGLTSAFISVALWGGR